MSSNAVDNYLDDVYPLLTEKIIKAVDFIDKIKWKSNEDYKAKVMTKLIN